MSERIDAIFENGVFRPEVPIHIANGQRVSLDVASLDVESRSNSTNDLGDVADLLDLDFMESCRQNNAAVPSIDEVRNLFGKFKGSLADRIIEERDER
jgi:predicted DNA-binding antitoxin AbrB/MazE fold protein